VPIGCDLSPCDISAIVYPGVYPSGFLLVGHFQQSLAPQAQTQFSPPLVRSTPESGHVRCNYGCLLWVISGHSAHSFDHLIGGIQEPFRNRQTECLSGLEIDVELDFSGPLHRQVGGLVALENPACVDAS
jgi:hypothetical protein